jgi:hypothetical protein
MVNQNISRAGVLRYHHLSPDLAMIVIIRTFIQGWISTNFSSIGRD